jgi:hypothetical protein
MPGNVGTRSIQYTPVGTCPNSKLPSALTGISRMPSIAGPDSIALICTGASGFGVMRPLTFPPNGR